MQPVPLTLDKQLTAVLKKSGFTGRIESTLEKRLGRKVNQELADLGNLLFFDKILALGNDNSCAGCHSPGHGFGDSQSIAIGIGNNDVVGPGRKGPRNQRRTPLVVNNAFYPKLMWNGRFAANSGFGERFTSQTVATARPTSTKNTPRTSLAVHSTRAMRPNLS